MYPYLTDISPLPFSFHSVFLHHRTLSQTSHPSVPQLTLVRADEGVSSLRLCFTFWSQICMPAQPVHVSKVVPEFALPILTSLSPNQNVPNLE